jgi:hypothetical protein
MRYRIPRGILAGTAVVLLVAQFGCAARTVAPSPAPPSAPTAEADRRACEAYADKHPSKSVLARTLVGGLVLLPLGAGVAVLGLAAGRPDGLVLPFMAFNPAIVAPKENRTTRERALAACLDPVIQAQTLGPRHPEMARSLGRLAAGYAAVGEVMQAEALYRRVLAIQEDALGPDHEDVALTLAAHAALLRTWDRAVEAAALERRIEAIRTRAAAEGHDAAGGETPPPGASELTGAEVFRSSRHPCRPSDVDVARDPPGTGADGRA